MLQTSIISFSSIKTNLRFDAEFYRPDFIEVEKIMSAIPSIKLGKVLTDIKASAFYGSISFSYRRDKGIPFVRVSDIEEPFLNMKNILYLPSDIVEKEKGLSTITNDYLLISKGGTIGNLCFIPEEIKKVIISRDIIGIKVNEAKVNKFFILGFLMSRYGKFQLLRGISRQTLPHLTLNIIKEAFVYLIDNDLQLQVERLVKQAYEKRKLADQKYQQAEEKLYKLLGIDKKEIEKLEAEKTYETNFKEVSQAFRFDAEYYHPKYLGIIELLKKVPFEVKPLKEVIKISNEKIDPTKEPYKTKRYKYVSIAKINESGEIFEWEEFYGWQAPSRARMLIRNNDILIPSLAGTFDKIALVPAELDGQLASTGCFVIRSKEDYPEFLFLLFRTPLFKRQLEQLTTGAIMSAVPKTTFDSLLVPVIPKDKQEEIVSLIKDY
ncbi:MAG: hypothetical protein C0175_04690, partial [Caldisericum exile]